MEEPVNERQPPAAIPGSAGESKLHYPFRSSVILKEENPSASDLSNSTSFRRAKATPSVSKGVGVLHLSNKKSAKPPGMLSIPTKSHMTPSPKLVGTITPVAEARLGAEKSRNGEGKSDTPLSDAARSAVARKGFSMLSSASYWLRQIKLSESASKHSVSLGFFKLAVEAGCEPLQGMRNELKSYVSRHSLSENEEAIKELLESYNVSENSDQPQESETCSQIPEEGTRSSESDDDEVPGDSSAVGSRKLKPKSLNTSAARLSTMTESEKKATPKNNLATRNRVSNNNSSNSRSVSDTRSRKLQKKTWTTAKLEPVKAKDKTERQETTSANKEGQVSPPAAVETVEEDKENSMVTPLTEEISLPKVM